MERIIHCFSELLSYPTDSILQTTDECIRLLKQTNEQAALELQRCKAALAQLSSGEREELYTRTFDVMMQCYPYTGYYLFGESYKRGEFLARLKERYDMFGFRCDTELPDHIAVMLRFIASIDCEEEIRVLVEDCLIPSLRMMTKCVQTTENPYGRAIKALALLFGALENRDPEPISKYILQENTQ